MLMLNHKKKNDICDMGWGMDDAEKAFIAAKKLIAEAKASGATLLNLSSDETIALTKIPPEIAELSELASLVLNNTNISDLGPIRAMRGITYLSIYNTSVGDLKPISGLQGLGFLDLGKTLVRELTQISDMRSMTALFISDTAISDLGPIRNMDGMGTLHIDKTQVEDLRPIIKMKGLTDIGFHSRGVYFTHIPALGLSTDLAEISEIKESDIRGAKLLKFLRELKEWPPKNSLSAPTFPTPPDQRPAPIMAEFEGEVLVELPATHDLADPVEKRARQGWEALKEFYEDVHETLMKDNLPNLQRAITSFGRALGDQFDDMREVSLGTHGERIVEISKTADAILLEDAAADLSAFAAAIQLHLSRFPEWVAYLEDARKDTETDLVPTLPQLQELSEQFKETDFISSELAEKFDDLVEVTQEQDLPASIARYGMLTSLSNILARIAGKALKVGRNFANDVGKGLYQEAVDGTVSSISKAVKYSKNLLFAACAGFFISQSTVLHSLAQRFPKFLSWVDDFLRFLGVL